MHHLNELLVNLEAWKGKGNQRISLAPGVGGAQVDDSYVCTDKKLYCAELPLSDDSLESDRDDDDAWQFNVSPTIRCDYLR